jgi:hypothetical protein
MTAALRPPGSARPFVRIRRAPALEPPVDDDRRADDHPVCAGQLALFASIGGSPHLRLPDVPAQRPSGAALRSRSRPGLAAAARPGPAGGPEPTAGPADTAEPGTPSASMAAHVAASRFVSACVEVLNGFRPAGHLRALTTPFDFATVTTQLTRRAARLRMPAHGRREHTGAERVDMRRLRVFEQRAGVAEAVAVLRHGDASWAMALRFERRRGTWLCTLLEVV